MTVGRCTECDREVVYEREPARCPDDGAPVLPDLEFGAALGRLPGVAGQAEEGGLTCPACGEPNPLGQRRCLRCHSLLQRPTPPVVPIPGPEPLVAAAFVPAPPEVVPPSWWHEWWPALVIVGFLVAVALLVLAVV